MTPSIIVSNGSSSREALMTRQGLSWRGCGEDFSKFAFKVGRPRGGNGGGVCGGINEGVRPDVKDGDSFSRRKIGYFDGGEGASSEAAAVMSNREDGGWTHGRTDGRGRGRQLRQGWGGRAEVKIDR